MPVKGVKEVNQNIKRFIDKARGPITEVTLTKVLIAGAAHAARITPVDTSNLINSQFRRVEKGASGMFGRVGYTAAYARFVHDGGEKSWQKASAEAQFLRKGFERDGLGEIKRIIAQGYKV
jgi:hypothetical protein